MKTYTYRIVIEPDEEGYHGFAPLLKGVHTSGETIEKTKENLKDAIQCHLEGLLKDHITPPEQCEVIESIQIQLKHPDGRRTTVPYHPNHEIRPGTLKAILDDIEINTDEFINVLKK